MIKKLGYKHTLTACFSGYITQAIVVNFIPLLFISFCTGYGISLEKVTMLVTINFFLQLLTDLASTKLIGKIGYRAGIVSANVLAMVGLIFIAVFPDVIDPYVALVIGMAELDNFRETPVAVVIDETVNLSAKYSTENSTNFVNGILSAYLKEKNYG